MTAHRVALLGETARRVFGPVLAFQRIPHQRVIDGADAVVVCDPDQEAVKVARDAGVPMLVGAEALRVAADELDGATGWLPLLPLRLARDVDGARAAIIAGEVGRVDGLAIISYYGQPERAGWLDDEVRPTTWFEAAVWALDLAEQLAGAHSEHTSWIRSQGSGPRSVILHRLDGGAVATVWHVPCALGPGPAYSATVLGDQGQLALRQMLAPGGLVVWRGETREITVPALAKPEQVGGGVSTPGGWEYHVLLRRLADVASDPIRDNNERARALRIVRHLDHSTPTT